MKVFSLAVLMYHYVRDPGDRAEAGSGIPGLPVAHFEAQLDHVTQAYTMIAWPDLKEHLRGRKFLPPNTCLLTFDDGVCDHYLNVFPSLRRRGLSGLFFALARKPGTSLTLAHKIHFLLARLGRDGLREVFWLRLSQAQRDLYQRTERHYQAKGYSSLNVFKAIAQRDLSAEADTLLSQLFAETLGSETKIADEYFLTPDQITEMTANGMHFGGHSRTHPWFDWVDEARQAEEINASAEGLREIEAGPWAFAYPYGGYNARSPELLRTQGFVAAFTTVAQATHSDPFLIGRLDAEEFSPELSPLQTTGQY